MFKQLVKDSALYGFADFAFKIIAFFTFPIFANLLTVSDFGVMTLAVVIAGFVGMFINLGLNNALQRFYFDKDTAISDRPALVSSGYILLFFWSLTITLIAIGIAFIFRNYTLEAYELPFTYLALALLSNVPTQLLTYSTDVIRLHFKPIRFLVLSICRNLAGVVMAIVLMVYFKLGLYGYFLANFAGVVLFVPLGIYLSRPDSRLLFDRSIAKRLVQFGFPFIFAGLAYWLFGSMDRWMLGEWSTMEQTGLYGIAFKIGSVLLFINTAFGQAWSPVAIKVMNENPSDYKLLFSRLFIYWSAFLLIVGTIASLFVFEFLFLTTPKEYWSASTISIWITMGLVVNGTTQLTALGISISRKTKYFTYIAWITALINFVFNYLLIPEYGALGSAIATFFTYIVLSGSYLFMSQSLHPLPLDKKKLGILICFLFFTIAIATWFNSINWEWSLIIYKLLWIGLIVWVFLKGKIIDIDYLIRIFNKQKYEK